MKALATLTLIACLPLLASCQRDEPPAPEPGSEATPAPTTALGRTVARAMDEARKELREGDMSLNGDYDVRINGKRIRHKASDLPPAEITPEGELRVSGSTVAMDDDARALARDYRLALIEIAEAGMDLGVRGADLGMKAAGDAIGSLLRGDTDEMEKRIEAEAEQLEAAAMQLCDRLPRLLAAQQALAAAVPEFAPYARMDADDIDDCRDHRHRNDSEADARAERADERLDAAAEADAAADAASATDPGR
ncbi:hypothetical protein [Luteimonas saliphila]|uniref:hypothetical protein n=1 Tax=Luteimonas saliphila TaxID=2804919 RepID=UPI00192D86E7|nr:hypothetical protein [Luteimonas saliphila]